MAAGTAFATATTSDTEAVAENQGRASLIIVNDSDTVVYLSEVPFGKDAPAVVGRGIRLNANGGEYDAIRAGNRQRIHTGAIRVMHSGSGDKNLTVSELDGR